MISRLLLAVALGSSGFATEVTFTGISLPEIDASGHVVRRLKAESGTGSLTGKSTLKNALVEFFAPAAEPVERIATLDFDEAIYDGSLRIIDSERRVVLRSKKGDLAATGFNYDLARNLLRLKSAVTFDFEGAHLVGREGEAQLVQTPSTRESLIEKATVKGGVVVTGISNPKFDFDQAATESAVYTASDETITLASPVHVWKNGKKISTEFGEMKIHVGKSPKPASASGSPAIAPGEKSH